MNKMENILDYGQKEDFTQFYTSVQGTMLVPGAFLDKGNYRLEKKLGEGGMAQVWLAAEISGGRELRKVVCKLLPRPVQTDSEAILQIEKVFNLTQGLNHSSICPIYGMRSDPTFGWFFVMAYADGLTLENWFRRQPNFRNGLPLSKVFEILEPLARALDYAHAQDVIHRDVKPQNVMFTGPRRRLWLLDFGIAAKIHSTMTATLGVRATSGTPHFKAPEQWLPSLDPNSVQDGRTDQYALGIMAYYFLSGQLPFSGDFNALGFQALNIAPPPILRVSSSVNAALQKALAKNRYDRFENCVQFVSSLCDSAFSFALPHGNTLKTGSKPAFTSAFSQTESFQEFFQREEPFFEQLLKDFHDLQKEWTGTSNPVTSKKTECRAQGEKIYKWCKMTIEASDSEIKRLLEIGMRPNAPRVVELQEELEIARKSIVQFLPDQLGELLRTDEELMGAASERLAGYRFVRTVHGIDYAFRWCPAGTFLMGTKGLFNFLSDGKSHKVTLTKGFWMLETEVSQAMWKSMMGRNPSRFVGSDFPVECVNWSECQEFCQILTAKLGGKVSLPTEAQWEYACRAGTTGAYAGKLDAMAWYDKNSGNKTHPVGQKQPNAWGLYNMHGNVWEWCEDWYDAGWYAKSPTSDPLNTKEGSYRVFRGGSWFDDANSCRSANRGGNLPGSRFNSLGFRVVWQDK